MPSTITSVHVLSVWALAFAMPGAVWAQGAAGGAERPISVWLGVGTSTPISDFKELAKSGTTVQGAIQYRPDGKPLGVRGELQAHRMDMTPDLLADEGATKGNWSLLVRGVAGVYELMPQGRTFGWYVLAGGGSYRITAEAPEESITPTDTSGKKTWGLSLEEKVGFNVGTGIRIKLGPASLFIEGRFHSITDKDLNVKLLPVSVGIIF